MACSRQRQPVRRSGRQAGAAQHSERLIHAHPCEVRRRMRRGWLREERSAGSPVGQVQPAPWLYTSQPCMLSLTFLHSNMGTAAPGGLPARPSPGYLYLQMGNRPCGSQRTVGPQLI